MVPEKLNWFRKFLSKVGKRLLWSRQPKENGLFFSLTYLEDIKMLMDLVHDGSLETALKEFHRLGRLAGHDITYEFLDVGKYVFSKSLEDLPKIIETSYYVMTGQKFSSCKYLPKDEKNPARVIFTLDRCMFCGGMKKEKSIEVNKETMGTYTWGEVMSGIVEAAVETIEDYVGNTLKIEVNETKCIMKGDPYAEFTIVLSPKQSE